MPYALSWLLVVALLALWSLSAWTLHAAAAWAVANAGTLSGAASGVGRIDLPQVLAPWVPPELVPWVQAGLAGLGPVIDGLLQAMPALAGGVTVATGVIWGLGSVLILLLGAGLHLLIALWRRRGGGAGGDAGPSPVAG